MVEFRIYSRRLTWKGGKSIEVEEIKELRDYIYVVGYRGGFCEGGRV